MRIESRSLDLKKESFNINEPTLNVFNGSPLRLAHFVAFACDIFNICISSNDGVAGIYAS